MLTKLCVLAAIWMHPSFVIAGEALFSVRDCEDYLGDQRPIPADVRERADELYRWLNMSHPVLGSLLESVQERRDAFSLLFLASGYGIAPATNPWQTLLLSGSDVRSYYCERLSFSNERGHSVTDSAIRLLRQRCTAASRLGPREPEALRFLAMLLDRTFDALAHIADPSSRTGTHIVYQRHFGKEELGAYQTLVFAVNAGPSREVDRQLSRMAASLDDREVRRDLTWLVARHLPRIIAFHRGLHKDLKGVSDIQGARALHREAVRSWEAGHFEDLESSRRISPAEMPVLLPGPAKISVATDTPSGEARGQSVDPDESAPLPAPPEIDVSRDFLEREYRVAAIADLPLLDLHRDLRASSAYLSASLARVRMAESKQPDWARWQNSMDPSLETVRHLEARSHAYAKDLDAILRLLGHASNDVGNLRTWLTKLNAALAALDLGNKASELEALSAHDQVLISSLVSLLPTLTTVTERALEGLERQREVAAKRLDASAHVGVFASNQVEAILRGGGDDEAFLILREAVNAMAVAP